MKRFLDELALCADSQEKWAAFLENICHEHYNDAQIGAFITYIEREERQLAPFFWIVNFLLGHRRNKQISVVDQRAPIVGLFATWILLGAGLPVCSYIERAHPYGSGDLLQALGFSLKSLARSSDAPFAFCAHPLEMQTRLARKSLGLSTVLDTAFLAAHQADKEVIAFRSKKDWEKVIYAFQQTRRGHAFLLYEGKYVEIAQGSMRDKGTYPYQKNLEKQTITEAAQDTFLALEGDSVAAFSASLELLSFVFSMIEKTPFSQEEALYFAKKGMDLSKNSRSLEYVGTSEPFKTW
ncbi:MAG: hypothetical protein AAGI90_02885 [Chlamydiota bacterium]